MLAKFLLLMVSLKGSSATRGADVDCLIINLEYVNCTWEPRNQHFNYTFYSTFEKTKNYIECQKYLWRDAYSIGCQVPYTRGARFNNLLTKLLWGNSSKEQHHDLLAMVKPNPPTNLSVVKVDDSLGLWLYWNFTMLPRCTESAVRYRKDLDPWKEFPTGMMNYFNVPVPSKHSSYTFQVRVRVTSSCGESKFWSEWSSPVSWHPALTEESPMPTNVMIENKLFLYFVFGAIPMFALVCVLVQCKRLIPVVPNPGKNFQDLLHTYNGNVEEWLHSCIPKELVDGFRPSFSESACTVKEYFLLPQALPGQSTCSLPIFTDQSDCLFTSCSTSTSTIPTPLENTPPNPV